MGGGCPSYPFFLQSMATANGRQCTRFRIRNRPPLTLEIRQQLPGMPVEPRHRRI